MGVVLLLLMAGFVLGAGAITVIVLLLVTLNQKNQKIAALRRENDLLRDRRARERDFPDDLPPDDAFATD
jgi:hypothetical protein